MQFLWKYIDDLVGKGLEGRVIAELLFFTSANLVTMALPIAILFASIMTFGNMGENNELLACKSAGISLQRVMSPLIIIIVLITISAHFFSNYVLPVTNLKYKTLLYDIQKQKPAVQIPEGAFYNGIPGYTIRVNKKDKETNLLKDIIIYNHTNNNGNTSITVADSGRVKMTVDEQYIKLDLYNGYSYTEENQAQRGRRIKTYPHRRDIFDKQTIRIKINQDFSRSDENIFKRRYQMLNISQLDAFIDTISREVDTVKMAFNRSVSRKTFFKIENKKARKKQIYINNFNPYQIVDVDSVFRSLKLNKQKTVLKQALNSVRTDKNKILNATVKVKTKIETIRRYQVALHMKFVFPFACLIFFFIGAPLGAIIRKGGLGLPSVISVVFFLFYYIVSLMGEKFVREDMMPAYIGMWISSAILLPVGVFLTYKATTDAVILNSNMYIEKFKKYLGLEKKAIPLDEKYILTVSNTTLSDEEIIKSLTQLNISIDDFYKEYEKKLAINILFGKKIIIKHLIPLCKDYNNLYGIISKGVNLKYRLLKLKLNESPRLQEKEFDKSNIIIDILLKILLVPPFIFILFLGKYIQYRVLKRKLILLKTITASIINYFDRKL